MNLQWVNIENVEVVWLLASVSGLCFFISLFYSVSAGWNRADRLLNSERLRRPELKLKRRTEYALEVSNLDNRFRRMVDCTRWEIGSSQAGILISLIGLTVLATGFVITENLGISIGASLVAVLVSISSFAIRSWIVQSKIESQLPGMIEMLAGAMRAGVSVEQGLASVGSKATGFLAKDLLDCSRKIELGLPASDALNDFSNRYDLLDLRLLTAAVSTHRQTGGDLAAVMDQLARVARERLEFRKQLSSMTVSARMAAGIVGLAMPVLIAYYSTRGNSLERLWDDPTGRFFLLVAFGLEGIGLLWVLVLTRRFV